MFYQPTSQSISVIRDNSNFTSDYINGSFTPVSSGYRSKFAATTLIAISTNVSISFEGKASAFFLRALAISTAIN